MPILKPIVVKHGTEIFSKDKIEHFFDYTQIGQERNDNSLSAARQYANRKCTYPSCCPLREKMFAVEM